MRARDPVPPGPPGPARTPVECPARTFVRAVAENYFLIARRAKAFADMCTLLAWIWGISGEAAKKFAGSRNSPDQEIHRIKKFND